MEQGSRPQGSQRPGTPRGGTLSSRSSPPLREPREGEGDDLADVDTKEGGDNDDRDDDNDDDDAFVSDHAEGAASSPWPIHLPSVLSTPHRGALRAQPLDKLRDRYGQGDDHKPLVCLREEDSGDSQRDEREETVDGGRRHVARPNDDLDGDDDLDSDEGEDDDGRGGVASTTYRHGPLLMHVTLPGGGRLRPLVARTTSTQTPHLHCQLMDQVLAGPPDLPHSVRGEYCVSKIVLEGSYKIVLEGEGFSAGWDFGWLLACLTSQQQASVSQGRICSDNFTRCHTEIEVADSTFHLTQSQYADTGPTIPSADPVTPGA